MAKQLTDYRVTFEDGSTFVVEMAYNKTEARKIANKYLTDYCGYFGRHAGPRPKIMSIEKIEE
jgi:hypothetical protein